MLVAAESNFEFHDTLHYTLPIAEIKRRETEFAAVAEARRETDVTS